MRGEPVLPSKFVGLFDSPSSTEINGQQVRKNFTIYHELDHHCEKFDETLVDFNRRLTQSATDVRELLNGTYARFPLMEKIPQLIDLDSNEPTENLSPAVGGRSTAADILDQSSTENDQLPAPLAPEIVPHNNEQ